MAKTTKPVVAVTGGHSTLGRAIALTAARAGHPIALIARSQEQLDRVHEEIRTEGGTSARIPCDITQPDQVRDTFQKIEDGLGPTTVLVNNAGVFLNKPFLETTPEEARRQMEVNYFGALYCIQAVLPGMLETEEGSIINILATGAVRSGAERGPFHASKAALRSLTHALAREYQNREIHFAGVVIDGMIWREEGSVPADRLDPFAVAREVHRLIGQDPSAWTLEVDVRPQAAAIET